MSLPNELREQLLSGYLDDALSADERTRVDQLLASDAEFASELEQLRELRVALQAIARSDEHVKLGRGFADRVLDAAVAQARSEGLNEDHPLLRLAEQPSLPHRQRSLDWRLPVSVAALAASIALAIFIWSLGNPDQVAEEDSGVNESIAEVSPESSDSSLLADGSSDGSVTPESVGPDRIRISEQDRISEQSPDSTASVDPEMIVNNDLETTSPGTSDDGQSVATTEGTRPTIDPNSLENQMLLGGSPVMVYSVRLTEQGKQDDAISNALTSAQIGAARQRSVTDEIAGFIAKDDKLEQVANAKVLYLQAPLKSLDRFYLSLMADEVGVARVGMTIAFNAPIRRLADSLKVDPTSVQHDGRVIELVSSTPTVTQLASQLDQLPFDFSRTALEKLQNDGPDEMGQVLVLVLP